MSQAPVKRDPTPARNESMVAATNPLFAILQHQEIWRMATMGAATTNTGHHVQEMHAAIIDEICAVKRNPSCSNGLYGSRKNALVTGEKGIMAVSKERNDFYIAGDAQHIIMTIIDLLQYSLADTACILLLWIFVLLFTAAHVVFYFISCARSSFAS